MQERLQKIIAHAGISSRRRAEDLIREGRVTVNGKAVTQVGTKADPSRDHIKVDGKRLRPQTLVYFAVHKPIGVLSASSDPRGRKVVTDLVPRKRRLYPAGRLDYNSEGLVLVTNDGDLARRVTTVGRFQKVYRVKVRGVPKESALKRLRNGARVDGVQLAPCRIETLKVGSNSWLRVSLKQGKNRQIRKMFDSIGHTVMRLRRVSIGPLRLNSLAPGQSRRLTTRELRELGVTEQVH